MLEAQAYAIGNFQRGYQTVGAILDSYEDAFIYEEKIEKFDEVPQRIRAVTAKDVVAAANLCLKQVSPWSLSFYGAIDEIDAEALRHIVSGTYR